MKRSSTTDQIVHTKLYKTALFIGLILSVIAITGNFMGGLPIVENIKWLVLLITCTVSLALFENNRAKETTKFILFFIIIWIFIPLGFIETGSSKNVTFSYLMLTVILVSLLFSGVKRIFFLASLLTVFVILHFLDYHFKMPTDLFTDESYFLDQLIQIPFIMLSAIYILIQYANEYAKLNQRLDDQANIDVLTTLYNRRGFNKAIQDIVKYNITNAQLGFIDIDNFKQLNDSYGHSIGDEALRVLSNFMRQAINPSQHILARWGGDEFAIIYYGNKSCLEAHLENIKNQFINYAANYLPVVNISMSVISFSDYNSLEEAITAADKLLYKDKYLKNK
ncbi:GGDEF domain-containing protein [Acholeplasma hippikon]|uniref:Probable diguanylate cyclase AdrA n=1 Tax=Acholeplasma hippikon TaxID=264636 RepID=A0A449BKB7_9MOLU|nr:GGDEF domain-containing protein [Acholeplasma hippikon]VEU82777.1 Probable diguanylate cyclase AdrA [Acholeplasma hippikon]